MVYVMYYLIGIQVVVVDLVHDIWGHHHLDYDCLYEQLSTGHFIHLILQVILSSRQARFRNIQGNISITWYNLEGAVEILYCATPFPHELSRGKLSYTLCQTHNVSSWGELKGVDLTKGFYGWTLPVSRDDNISSDSKPTLHWHDTVFRWDDWARCRKRGET